jgi:glycosyltransferase involved in cell wall biosynthesis
VVTCHDLDTFRCLLEPAAEPRPWWFRAMTRRILGGMVRAARLATPSAATRDRLIAAGLAPPERVVVAPNGVHPAYSPPAGLSAEGAAGGAVDAEAEAAVTARLGPAGPGTVELLQVGSTIPRKRIDVALAVLAAVRGPEPRARLVRVGGALTAPLRARAAELGVAGAVVELPHLGPPELAAVYRRSALLLQPSEREGFGLPVAEAMACGTPAVASAIPALVEVGGDGAGVVYRPVGDVAGWSEAVSALLAERRGDPERWRARRRAAAERGARFSWSAQARLMASLYADLSTSTR